MNFHNDADVKLVLVVCIFLSKYILSIGHVLNQQGLGTSIFSLLYEDLISIKLKNGACRLKGYPKISKFTKFDGYWLKRESMVHLVWIGGTGSFQSAYFKSVPCLCV